MGDLVGWKRSVCGSHLQVQVWLLQSRLGCARMDTETALGVCFRRRRRSVALSIIHYLLSYDTRRCEDTVRAPETFFVGTDGRPSSPSLRPSEDEVSFIVVFLRSHPYSPIPIEIFKNLSMYLLVMTRLVDSQRRRHKHQPFRFCWSYVLRRFLHEVHHEVIFKSLPRVVKLKLDRLRGLHSHGCWLP